MQTATHCDFAFSGLLFGVSDADKFVAIERNVSTGEVRYRVDDLAITFVSGAECYGYTDTMVGTDRGERPQAAAKAIREHVIAFGKAV
jgi:hypothetical protein